MRFLRDLWGRAISPVEGFRERAASVPTLGAALRRMFLLRTPLAFASSALGYWGLRSAYQAFRGLEGATGDLVCRFLPVSMNAEDLRSALAELPHLPALGRVWPWLLLGAPLGVLGLWLHDAVWDHGCLWMLGGLKARPGFRATMIAEAEALSVGSIGAVIGFLGYLPYLGWVVSLPLAAIEVWFWVLRGFALAAWHECPIWKGIGATVLHGVLAACCLAGLLGFCFVVLVAALA